MCPKCDKQPRNCWREATSIAKEEKRKVNALFVRCLKKVAQLSTMIRMSKSSLPKFVYSRRKLRSNSVANYLAKAAAKRMKRVEDFLSVNNLEASSVAFKEREVNLQVVCKNEVEVPQLSNTSTNSSLPKFAYSRRKLCGEFVANNFLIETPVEAKKCMKDFLSLISSDAPSAAFKDKETVLEALCDNEVVGVPQLSTINTISASSLPKFAYARRKLHRNSVANNHLIDARTNTEKSVEDFLSRISSDASSVAFMEKEAVLQATSQYEVAGVSQLSIINTTSESSLYKFVYSRKKLHGNSVKNNQLKKAPTKTKFEEKELVLQAISESEVGVPQLSTIIAMSESFLPKFVYGRKKLRRNSVTNYLTNTSTKPKKNEEDFHSIISSDAPSVAFKENEVDPQAVCENEIVAAPQLSTIGMMHEGFLPKFVYTRRKLQNYSEANYLAESPAKTKKSLEDFLSGISSDVPSIVFKEKEVVRQVACENEVVGVPQPSTISTIIEGSLPKFVYSRSKLQRKSVRNCFLDAPVKTKKSVEDFLSVMSSDAPSIAFREKEVVLQVMRENEVVGVPQLSTINTIFESSLPKFVYNLRKLRSNSLTNDFKKAPVKTEESVSIISSYAPSVSCKEKAVALQATSKDEVVGVSSLPSTVCNSGPSIQRLESSNGLLFMEGNDFGDASMKSKVNSLVDGCSSSNSAVEITSASVKTVVDDIGECSSSSPTAREAMDKDRSVKDFCISILRSEGMLELVCNGQNHVSGEIDSDFIDSSGFQSCRICNSAESSLKMLICDTCEEAFHLSCCNVKHIPVQEWFCHSCLKKKRKVLRETVSRKRCKIAGAMEKYKSASRGKLNPIALMLRDTCPYTTGVRVGKGFQADVPDWSGPIFNSNDAFGEPPELVQSQLPSHEASVISSELSSFSEQTAVMV